MMNVSLKLKNALKYCGSGAQLLYISKRVEWDFCMGECTIIYDYIGEYTTLKKDILNTL